MSAALFLLLAVVSISVRIVIYQARAKRVIEDLRDARLAPFALEVDGGEVMITGPIAIQMKTSRVTPRSPEDAHALLASHKLERFATSSDFEEALIQTGDRIAVAGVLIRERLDPAGYRDVGEERLRFVADPRHPVTLSGALTPGGSGRLEEHAVFSPRVVGSDRRVDMGRLAALTVLLGLGACMDQAPIEVDRPAIDLPRGAGTDVVVTQDDAPFPLDELVWLIDDPSIAQVSRTSDGARLRIEALAEGATTIHVGSHGQRLDIPTHVSPPAFVQLWIEPSVVTTTVGATVPIRATAIDTTNEIRDVSAMTGWQLVDPGVATLDNMTVRGMHSGHTVLQAVLADTTSEIPITVF